MNIVNLNFYAECVSKIRCKYNCFYLTRDNVEAFLEWFKWLGEKSVNTYKDCKDHLEIYTDIFNQKGVANFYYDHWQIFKDDHFYDCGNDVIFKMLYELVEE